MGMKFLNKKGWHTGSLRNIENVWKAEQKHDAEQRKLEELRKQIHEEREKSEFRLLQEQAGLVPKQERLDFLYDSGLAVGKGNSDGFKSLESLPPKPEPESSTSANKSSAPGALFEDKPQSANDAWRKLHSDPLLMIKQREQEALARVKNNPVQMAMIRKSVEAKKQKEKTSDKEKEKEKERHHHRKKKSKHEKHTSSKQRVNSDDEDEERNRLKHKDRFLTDRHKRERYYNVEERFSKHRVNSEDEEEEERSMSPSQHRSKHKDQRERDNNVEKRYDSENGKRDREDRRNLPPTHHNNNNKNSINNNNRVRRNREEVSKEERAARLKEMQMDAELHEEQRWRRLKQAEDDDAKEVKNASSSGRNFLDVAHKSIYGAEKGGSSSIEESVRRRTHYSQKRSEGNAFKR